MEDIWETRLNQIRRKVENYKRIHQRNHELSPKETVPIDLNKTLGYMQSMALQSLQLQQAVMQNAVPDKMDRLDRMIMERRKRYENFQIKQIDKAKYTVKSGQIFMKTLNNSRFDSTKLVQKRWRVIIYFVIAALRFSKKYRAMEVSKNKKGKKSVMTIIQTDIATMISEDPAFKVAYSELLALGSEGVDFLIKDKLSLFNKKPSKIQTTSYAKALTGIAEAITKLNVSSLSKNIINTIKGYLFDSTSTMPKNYLWENEQPIWEKQDVQNSKMYLLLYLIVVKSTVVTCLIKAKDIRDIDEHNLRSVALIYYKIVRQIGSELFSDMKIESQFKRALQFSTQSSEEANAWNDHACKLMFKNVEGVMKDIGDNLFEWATKFVTDLTPTKDDNPTAPIPEQNPQAPLSNDAPIGNENESTPVQ
ncbi:hypothetical protein BC833DRAFT_595878 [Globomyces pollinis-pini]|nr:hypothetical protein BC833DRAFT_595878 [Globomyces pollinis-pini]